jgi:hypothetical protein
MALFTQSKPAPASSAKAAAAAASKASLTADERALLGRLEAAVEAGLPHVSAMIEAGKALHEIRERQLYRGTASSFAVYLRDRWSLTPRRATQLVQFAGLQAVVEEILGDAAPQLTERAVRPLSGLTDEDAREAIREAAADGMTPAAIAKAAAKKRRSKRPPRPVRFKVPGATVVIEINRKGAAAGVTVEAALVAALEAIRRDSSKAA